MLNIPKIFLQEIKTINMVKVGLFQFSSLWNDVDGNISLLDKKFKDVFGYDIIVMPEMFVSGFSMEAKEITASRYDDIIDKMRYWANNVNALLVASTVYFDGKSYYNRLIAIPPKNDKLKVETYVWDGLRFKLFQNSKDVQSNLNNQKISNSYNVCNNSEINSNFDFRKKLAKRGENSDIAYYDKRHCFTMGEENLHFLGGDKLIIFEFRGVRYAPFICYDLRFPVWTRNIQNYDVAIYVANWPSSRINVWDTLLKARAIENQSYVIGVNRVGRDGMDLLYSGNSMLVDPMGQVVDRVESGVEKLLKVNIDINKLSKFRTRFPVLKDMDLNYDLF